jgi:two-component system chemotaxis response regulator CheB
VLTLDVEMPKMDGLDFLEKLMRLRPMPVLMVSSLTERGSEITMRALELGAVDFVTKPKISIQSGMREYTELIADKIRAAARARVKPRTLQAPATPPDGAAAAAQPADLVGKTDHHRRLDRRHRSDPRIPDADAVRLPRHPDRPAHAGRLYDLVRAPPRFAVQDQRVESAGNERVLPGHAYIAPGHSHLLLTRSGANYMTKIEQTEPVNRHRPSVDVLFRSAAQAAGKNAVGVILTGMGKDGAQGMLEMKNAGAYNFAQDEASCVVFGMPREAIAIGAAHEVAP